MRRASLAGSWILFCALVKICPSMPFCSTEFAQRLDVVDFQFRAFELLERRPVVLLRHADFAAVGRLRVFVRHLEEDEVGELLEVVAVAHAVVAQRVAEAPDFGDDAVGGHESVWSPV